MKTTGFALVSFDRLSNDKTQNLLFFLSNFVLSVIDESRAKR